MPKLRGPPNGRPSRALGRLRASRRADSAICLVVPLRAFQARRDKAGRPSRTRAHPRRRACASLKAHRQASRRDKPHRAYRGQAARRRRDVRTTIWLEPEPSRPSAHLRPRWRVHRNADERDDRKRCRAPHPPRNASNARRASGPPRANRAPRDDLIWLRQRGYASPDDASDSNDSPNLSFAELLANIGTQRGIVENLKDSTGDRDSPNEPAAPFTNEALTHLGFNLHANLTLRADDDRGRERLCRYGFRPPLALSSFRVLPDGRISYRMKKSTRRVSRCRVMTPVECIARLCALIPPPRYTLTRFHGVLAPHAKLRPRVVPKLPDSVRALRACNAADASHDATEKRDKKKREREERPPLRDRRGPIIPDALPISATLLAQHVDGAEVPAPNVLSAKHLDRIHGGLLFAATFNVPWVVLLARTFDVDKRALPSMRRTPRRARPHLRPFVSPARSSTLSPSKHALRRGMRRMRAMPSSCLTETTPDNFGACCMRLGLMRIFFAGISNVYLGTTRPRSRFPSRARAIQMATRLQLRWAFLRAPTCTTWTAAAKCWAPCSPPCTTCTTT